MSTMGEPDDRARTGVLERPDSPAQVFAAVAGLLLTALGVLVHRHCADCHPPTDDGPG